MNLTQILVFSIFSLLVCWFSPPRWRWWILLGSSLVAIFWMQSTTSIRNLDFWLPFASISLTVITWAIIRHRPGNRKTTLLGTAVIVGTILVIAFTRYTGPVCCLTPTRPPQLLPVLIALGFIGGLLTIINIFPTGNKFFTIAAIVLIIIVFFVLKTENLAELASKWLRSLTGQDSSLASVFDLQWLGFSFLALRLLHALRDHQSKKIPSYSLSEFVTYGIFFPSYTAGPIDRSQRFIEDLRKPVFTPSENTIEGSRRILIGIFKKFVLADGLALFALNSQNAAQTTSTFWLWVLLYAYALRIYFDFSGYTDVALGLGRLLGVKLPENFNKPYLKTSLIAFWNSWHITLAQWFRAYYFNPFTRYLRTRPYKPPPWLIIMIGQISTMLLIGLWHGVTWNFFAWGLWHGFGLFINNRWSTWVRPYLANLNHRTNLKRTLEFGGWFLTFQFVAIGWVWFALPTLELSWAVFQKLFGA